VALVIEVSDTTARYDLGKKAAIYAAGAIPEYWVVDINASVIHQLWSPTDGTYAERREVRLGDPVGAATLPDLQVATSGL
ncbi:Uma2 family endonuclease, partial [Acinetobacter baumannii]